jgi:hypothetical protein
MKYNYRSRPATALGFAAILSKITAYPKNGHKEYEPEIKARANQIDH